MRPGVASACMHSGSLHVDATPATITRADRTPVRSVMDWMLTLDASNVEWDEDAQGRLLVGVPAGHDTVFTVGPYVITLDI